MFVYNIVLICFAISPAVSSAIRNFASISTCRASEFTCLDGTCIRAGAVCDTVWDCPDGSDEASCYSSTNSNLSDATVSHERYKRQSSCRLDQWPCIDGTCIAVLEKCDGKNDCPDGSDETHALCKNVNRPTVSGKCELPPYPEHGTYVVINAPYATPGQRFQYAQLNIICNQGYGLVGDTVPHCLDGNWFTSVQNCVPFCRLHPDVSVRYYCQVPGAKSYRVCNEFEPKGTVVMPECNAPIYGSRDPLSMTCQYDGKWNRIFKCKPECGRVSPDAEGLVCGGTEVVRGELPWHVAIYEKPTKRRNYYKQICGGSLVSNWIVISAAHCFWKNEKQAASKYAVATAKLFRDWDHKDDKDAQKSEIRFIEIPPHYLGVRANYQHDIAVLILETPVVYYTYVRPVCLDLFDPNFNDLQLHVGNFGKVAGWGLTKANGSASPVLMAVQLPFVPIQVCHNITPETFTESITGDKMCAGYNDGKFRCQDGSAIPAPEVCDGNPNCPDGSDEEMSACAAKNECADGSDESDELCNRHLPSNSTDTNRSIQSGQCILPPYPKHGTFVVANAPYAKPGQSLPSLNLNVTCRPGYRVVGIGTVLCLNGTWYNSIPKCVRFCKLDKHPSVLFHCPLSGSIEGNRTCNRYEPSGTVVRPKCKNPNYYSAAGTLPLMRCIDGRWNYVAFCYPECGRVSDVDVIIDEKPAKKLLLPWHVSVYRKTTIPYMQICGGSLVSNKLVISAARCFWNDTSGQQPASMFAVAIGKIYRPWDSERDVDSQKSDVKEIKIPVQFQGSAANFQDDIAMLILETAFVFNMFVRPVCLDIEVNFDRRQLQPGNLGKVAGWGLTAENEQASQFLKVGELPYVDIEKCTTASPPGFRKYITSDKICAGYGNGTALCKGDSGGGLAFLETERGTERYFLRGIVSTAANNENLDNNNMLPTSRQLDRPENADKEYLLCNSNTFTTFTQISKHEHFIKEYL